MGSGAECELGDGRVRPRRRAYGHDLGPYRLEELGGIPVRQRAGATCRLAEARLIGVRHGRELHELGHIGKDAHVVRPHGAETDDGSAQRGHGTRVGRRRVGRKSPRGAINGVDDPLQVDVGQGRMHGERKDLLRGPFGHREGFLPVAEPHEEGLPVNGERIMHRRPDA